MADPTREIENLLYTYAERIDAGNLEGVADLFANGRILASAEAKAEQTFEGRDRVLALYRRSTRLYEDGTPHTKHVTTNAIIEVGESEKSASARSYYTVFQQVDDSVPAFRPSGVSVLLVVADNPPGGFFIGSLEHRSSAAAPQGSSAKAGRELGCG